MLSTRTCDRSKNHETEGSLIKTDGTFVNRLFIDRLLIEQIKWRPVLLGLLCQYLLAVFILRYGVGYYSFLRLGEFAETLFDFSNAGSKFVFGSNYMEHRFAFAVFFVMCKRY